MSESQYSTARTRYWREQKLEPSFASTINTIEEFCWEAMLVSSKQQSRSFAYSVGLYDTLGFPELITVGLRTDIAHSSLARAVDLMKQGKNLQSGPIRDLVGEVEVIFRPVSKAWYEKTMYRADWYYKKADVLALQLIYPDLENRFQWEAGFIEYFRQPLFRPDVVAGPAEHKFQSDDEDETSANWKFKDGRHTNSYLSQTVFDKTEPIVYVSRDSDGSWQFLGDSMSDGGGPVISCLHHPIDADPTLEELFDLPVGWIAERAVPGEPWLRYKRTKEEK
jgi:hypothetical protein